MWAFRSSIQPLSRVWLLATPWTAVRQASLSITNSWSSPKPMSMESVMPSNHLILCRPLLLLPQIPLSSRVFSNESALCIRWPEYWSFSFNLSPSNEHPGLLSFKDGLVGSPCSPRDSQEPSPTPQFKSISSSALSFLSSLREWKTLTWRDKGGETGNMMMWKCYQESQQCEINWEAEIRGKG